MLITFFASPGSGKIKATCLWETGFDENRKFSILEIFPGHNLTINGEKTAPQVSSYKKMHIYEVEDLQLSETPGIAFAQKMRKVKYRNALSVRLYTINGLQTKVFTLETSVPYHVWRDKALNAIVVAMGDIDEPKSGDTKVLPLNVKELQRMAIIRNEQELKEFRTLLHIAEPAFSSAFKHLGALKMVLVKGNNEGIVNTLFNTFIGKKILAHKEI